MDSWKKRGDERKRTKRKIQRQFLQLRETFGKFKDSFTVDKEKVINCITSFSNFEEKMQLDNKHEATINSFVMQLPDATSILEIKDLQRLMSTEHNLAQIEN